MTQVVEKFLVAEVIEVAPTQEREYLSTLFTIQEKTKVRPILGADNTYGVAAANKN